MQKNFISKEDMITRLSSDFNNVKLLAMGQTIYWDEPMKAILKRFMDKYLPDHVMVAGVHDADYFSKIPANSVPDGWHILPHNDGSTRDLWVAAGEISRIFGSETLPYRDLLSSYGVQLDKVAKYSEMNKSHFIDSATEAWGWRGLIHSNESANVTCCVPLDEALPHLISLLEWGFNNTIESFSAENAEHGRKIANELIEEVKSYSADNVDSSIADMYCHLLEKFYQRLLGYKPANLEITCATELFRFNKSTAHLQRFNLLDMFLDPNTKKQCQHAYNMAVKGSDAYTLDKFPDGAIPFDLVIPCMGRGTICLRKGRIVIDIDDPISILCDSPIESVSALADILEKRFGSEISIVGKALTLVLMIASEFIFILHEEASAYVPRCEKMASIMKSSGIEKYFYPILRMDYHTWDSLSASDISFKLTDHIGSIFGKSEISAIEFSETWKNCIQSQEQLLDQIAGISSIDDLLNLLVDRQPDVWKSKTVEYQNAVSFIRSLSDKTTPLKEKSVQLRDISYSIKQQIQQLEIEKGEHFRNNIKPLKDQQWQLESDGFTNNVMWDSIEEEIAEHERFRAQLEQNIIDKRDEAKSAIEQSLDIKNSVRDMEKSPEAESARNLIKQIEHEAELARLDVVKNAILVTKGLKYTDHRPSAWWFLMAEEKMRWFNKVSETVEFYFEEISL